MGKAILFCFEKSSLCSAEKGDHMKLAKDEYIITDKFHVQQNSWLTKALKLGEQGFTIIFDDFSEFKRIDKDLMKLYENQISFRFANLERVTNDSFLYFYDAAQFEKQVRSKKIREGLRKKRKEGKQLGNPDIGNKKGKVQRKRKLKAYKNFYYSFRANDIISDKIKENWSLNQIAGYLNQEQLRTQNGAEFGAKTVQRMIHKRDELRERFNPKLEFEDLDDGSNYSTDIAIADNNVKKKIQLEGLKASEDYEKAIKFKISSDLKEAFEIVILDNDQDDNTPVFQKVFKSEAREIYIDLDKHALLPGVHYINILTKEACYEPVINMRILLRPKMIKLVEDSTINKI